MCEFFFGSQLERVEPTDERPERIYRTRIFIEKNTLAVFIFLHLIDVGCAAVDSNGEMPDGFEDVSREPLCFVFKHDYVSGLLDDVSTAQGAPCAFKMGIPWIIDGL
jgi:hypothetical protein